MRSFTTFSPPEFPLQSTQVPLFNHRITATSTSGYLHSAAITLLPAAGASCPTLWGSTSQHSTVLQGCLWERKLLALEQKSQAARGAGESQHPCPDGAALPPPRSGHKALLLFSPKSLLGIILGVSLSFISTEKYCSHSISFHTFHVHVATNNYLLALPFSYLMSWLPTFFSRKLRLRWAVSSINF